MREPSYAGRTWQAWVHAARGDSEPERADARRALRALGPQALPALERVLTTRESELARGYWRLYGRTPAGLRGLLPQPVDSGARRVDAAEALEILGPAAVAAVPALVAGLSDPSLAVQLGAVRALGRVGVASAPAIERLAQFTAQRDSDTGLRVEAANALGRIGPGAVSAFPALASNLTHAQPIVRQTAALALGRIGDRAAAAVPRLRFLVLSDPDSHVRASAAEALGRIGPAAAAAAIPQLSAALRDNVVAVRVCAAEALGRLGPVARSAVADLLAAQRNDQSGVGGAVAASLARIAPGLDLVADTE
jgi:HEAT repeat protein